MARIKLAEGPPSSWTKYATIEVSKREAALLGIIMGKCNGSHKIVMDIYEKFIDFIREYDIGTVDLNSHSDLYNYLDTFGDE